MQCMTQLSLVRVAAAWFLTCLGLVVKADMPDDITLCDFQSPSNSARWEIVNDSVMGGISSSLFHVRTNACAVFSGSVNLENNGGFASVRSPPVDWDLAALNTFVLRVRGDGRRYKFCVRNNSDLNSPLYQCSFTTTKDEWTELHLAFKDFVPSFRGRILSDAPALDPATIRSLGFLISDKQAGPFRLEIEWIKAGASLD
jgi:hypothetical protein